MGQVQKDVSLLIDRTVGFWIKNVPYLFFKLDVNGENDDWKSYGRIYLISPNFDSSIIMNTPFSFLLNNEFTVPYGNLLKEKKQTKVCSNYFFYSPNILPMSYNTTTWKRLRKPIEVRVNGYKKYIPTRLLFGYNFYSFLKLENPHGLLENISKKGIHSEIIQQIFSPKQQKSELRFVKPKQFSRNEEDSPWYSDKKGQRLYDETGEWVPKLVNILCKIDSNICIPKISNDPFGYYINVLPNNKFSLDELLDEEYRRQLTTCISSGKNICIMISIYKDELLKIFTEATSSGHAVLILLNMKNKNVYTIDPHGGSLFFPSDRKEFTEMIDKVLNSLGLPKRLFGWNNYYMSHDVCPRVSFQRLENYDISYGFCLIWSMWLVHMINENPNIEYEELFSRAVQKIAKVDPDFTNFIHSYSAELIDEIKDMPTDISTQSFSLSGPCPLVKTKTTEQFDATNFKIKKKRYSHEYILGSDKNASFEQIKWLYTHYLIVFGFKNSFLCYEKGWQWGTINNQNLLRDVILGNDQ
jgi:predicted transcriptional regulator